MKDFSFLEGGRGSTSPTPSPSWLVVWWGMLSLLRPYARYYTQINSNFTYLGMLNVDRFSFAHIDLTHIQEQYPLSIIFPLLRAAKNDIIYFNCLSKFVLNVYIKSSNILDRQVSGQ